MTVPSARNLPDSDGSGETGGDAAADRDTGGSEPGRLFEVRPDACGDYADTDVGAKIKTFLQATVRLHRAVKDTERYVLETCQAMGREIGMSGLGDDLRSTCDTVANELRRSLRAGLSATAALDVTYEPAVCTVDADVAADAAAQCEAAAGAEVSASCTGVCEGTCQGQCDGTCAAGTSSQCAGACDGTCRGRCQGRCRGSADVDASAACRAHAAVEANLAASCAPPEISVGYDAAAVVDAGKLARAIAAVKTGLPRLLVAYAKLTGPVRTAYQVWSESADELRDVGAEYVTELGAQVACVTGQLAAAFGLLAEIQASIEVSVSVSVELSGSAGASI
jgi:hypothetical protein